MHSPAARSALLAAALVALVYAGRATPTCSACLAPKLPEPAPAYAPSEISNLKSEIPSPPSSPALPGHPLRGVILEILPEKSALLVAHEEIPGVMRAMTMLLKVNPADLAAAQKGQAITARLVKKPDGWWLESLAPAPSP